MQDEAGMQLYDFHARQYDPQIGRFWGIDPADQYPSGYTGMGNDPVNMIDPSGMYAITYGFGGQAQMQRSYWERERLNFEAWSERMHRSSPRVSFEELTKFNEAQYEADIQAQTAKVEQMWGDNQAKAEKTVRALQYERLLSSDMGWVENLSEGDVVLIRTGKNSYVDRYGNKIFGTTALDNYVKEEEALAAKEKVGAPGEFKSDNTEQESAKMCDMCPGEGDKQQKTGAENGAKKTQLVLGGADVALGNKELMHELAAASDAKVNNIKYIKGVKIVGKGIFVVQGGLSLYTAGSAVANNDPNAKGVVAKAGLDIIIGAASVWGGPVGWIIGGAYFIGDAAGWFGTWGDPKGK